jgi:hypothetical protein
MKLNKYNNVGNSQLRKRCAFCDSIFDPIRNTAIFCSDSCKQKCYLLRKKQKEEAYCGDPNEGKKLLPGTIPSQNEPEDTCVLSGDIESLYLKLKKYLSAEQLIEEKNYIESLKPISNTNDWFKSAIQIFTDDHILEVFRTTPIIYKLYAATW